MPYELYATVAEQIVESVDACLAFAEGGNKAQVAQFMDTTEAVAENSLRMAEQLLLLKQPAAGTFVAGGMLARMLVSCEANRKSAIFRYALEQFPPFVSFKQRFAINKDALKAGQEVKALYNLTPPKRDVLETLKNLGLYANALKVEAGGVISINEGSGFDYLDVTAAVINDRESAKLFVLKRIGEDARGFVNGADVLDQLVTAYQQAARASNDARAPIVNAANAIESLLVQVAAKYSISIAGATGINSKANKIKSAGTAPLVEKHYACLNYLGHVRNAADHGTDPTIGSMWQVSEGTAREYVHVSMSTVQSIVAAIMRSHFVV